MDGVSAVRAYTLLAVVALLAGGWMLNEAPSAEFDEYESSMLPLSDFAAEGAAEGDEDTQGDDQDDRQ